MTVTIAMGLAPQHRDAAICLYWEVFGGKLGLVMGPDARALRFLDRVVRADHVITASAPQGELLGILGFKSPLGGFAAGDSTDLRAVYGRFGGFWRGALLGLLSRDVDNERFLLDGICVTRSARSQGIGTALVAAACIEASARGYHAVRLDVIDTNWRAKALYKALGFEVTHTERLGWLRFVFGFAAATTMVKQISPGVRPQG